MAVRDRWLSLFAVVLGITAAMSRATGGEGEPLELDNEIVCRVNTEAISKRDVEDRMSPPGIAPYLRQKKAEWEHAKLWNEEHKAEWYAQYIPPFREALREVVRERLTIQYAKNEKINPDEKEYQHEYDSQIKHLRELSLLGSKGYTPAEIAKAVRDNLTIATYEGKFNGVLEQPTRPEIQAYYKANIDKYQRKAGVMVRIIRVDRIITNPLTKERTVREDAYDKAQEILQNVRDYQADFKEVARTKSDDVETRERGGLILPDPNDPYFDLDSCNPALAKAVRALKPGDPSTSISDVFEYESRTYGDGQTNKSWAIVQLVQRRDAGAEPLEGHLYDKIYKELLKSKSAKNQEVWFRKALATNLILRVEKGVSVPMPADFFFPDDPQKPVASNSDSGDKDKVRTK